MLSIPEIETHLEEMRKELAAQGAAIQEAIRNIGELRDQLQVARPNRDANPGPINSIGKAGDGDYARPFAGR